MPDKGATENPFYINCQEYGHSACYTKCPKFPKPKKGTPLTANKTFESNIRREGVSFANIVSGTPPPPPQSTIQFSKLTPIIQSKPLMRSHAPAITLVPATDFHAHHHQPRSKTKPILKQDRGLRD
ncbi:hypothetical protein TNCV_3916981 [Trichonephila clavipes]|nr:hypothetical protein TNCV_3916981 [Trichonephila clavipes]